jgi:hypothetical protein
LANSRFLDFSDSIGEIRVYERYKAASFEEYSQASRAWERTGLSLDTARALANAGFLTLADLHRANDFDLASVPRVGAKSLAILYALIGRQAPRRRRSGS